MHGIHHPPRFMLWAILSFLNDEYAPEKRPAAEVCGPRFCFLRPLMFHMRC